MSTKHKAILALIIANMIWGAASPIFKWSLTNIPPFTLAFLRFSIASFLLFPFSYKNLAIKQKDILSIAGIGFFGVFINISFFFLGLNLAPSINAPMIASSGPIVLIFLSILFLREKPKHKLIVGTLISLIGVLVIITRPFLETGTTNGALVGNIFFLIATIGAVLHALLSKELLEKYPPAVVTFWSFIVGSILFIPFFLKEAADPLFLTNLDIRAIVGIFFGALLSSALAYFLYEWAIKKIAVNEIGIFTYIDPVVAILIAIPLLGEEITPAYVLGSAFVFLGIFFAEGRTSIYQKVDSVIKNTL